MILLCFLRQSQPVIVKLPFSAKLCFSYFLAFCILQLDFGVQKLWEIKRLCYSRIPWKMLLATALPGGLQRSDLTWLRALPKAGGRTRPQRAVREKNMLANIVKIPKIMGQLWDYSLFWIVQHDAQFGPNPCIMWVCPKNTGCPQNCSLVRKNA